MAAVARAPEGAALQNYAVWEQSPAGARTIIHLDINGRDITNYVVAAFKSLPYFLLIPSAAAPSAAIFALTSQYSILGAALSSVAGLTTCMATYETASYFIENFIENFPDLNPVMVVTAIVVGSVGMVAATIAATALTANAYAIPFLVNSDNFCYAALCSAAIYLFLFNRILPPVFDGVNFAIDHIPNTRRIIISLNRITELNQDQIRQYRHHVEQFPEQWNAFLNQYAITHINRRFNQNHPIEIPAQDLFQGAQALH